MRCCHVTCLLPGVPSSSSSSRENSPSPSSISNHDGAAPDQSCVRTSEDQSVAKGWQTGRGRGRGRGGGNRGKAQRNLSDLMDGLDDDTSPDNLPDRESTYAIRARHKLAQQQQQQQTVYTQPDQKLRGTSSTFTDHQEASKRFQQTELY